MAGRHDNAARWLQFLLDHFLKIGARAARDTSGLFAGFTFDHQLDGLVAGYRHDTGVMWLIRPVEERIEEEIPRYGDIGRFG